MGGIINNTTVLEGSLIAVIKRQKAYNTFKNYFEEIEVNVK